MKIEVKVFATLRLKLGISGVELSPVQPVSVRKLLDLVCSEIKRDIKPELLQEGDIKKGTIILIDGKNVLHMDRLDTVIDKDCTVSLSLLPVVGKKMTGPLGPMTSEGQ